MPKGKNQKLKLYYLSRIMLEKTDDDHALSMPQIQKELAGYTIFRDVENANGPLTGIDNLTGSVLGRDVAYDLSGRRVSNIGKGVYIVGGRKVLR